MENNRKKAIGNTLLFLTVFALTAYAVFHGQDLPAMLDAIRDCDLVWLIPAIFCVVAFIWAESVILRLLIRSRGLRLSGSRSFLVSTVGFFFSAVTPAAGGGQPMQAYFLRREKIPIPVSAVTLMAITVTYKLVLVVIGAALALFGRGFLRAHLGGAMVLYWIGLCLTVGWIALLLVLVFHPHLAKHIVLGCLGLLERLRLVRRKKSRREKLLASMAQYSETAAYFKANMGLMALVLAITFLQRGVLFTVPWLVYRAFGLSGTGWFTIAVLQSVVSITADMLPLPGGMGVSEGVFLRIFQSVFGGLVLPGMVLSRGVEFYCRLLISAVFTALAFAVLGRHRQEREMESE